jgi:nondiscriminating glutamyl-tRNA synthetase
MSASKDSSAVITRFAPSPTGSLHLGNARTAFFSHLWARKSGGRFILRIEDTDVERSQPRFRDELMAEMRWLGLTWDEGPDIGGPSAPYSQAERGEFYQSLFARLAANGEAYPCYCTAEELELSRKLQRMAGKPPRYAGTCRNLTAAQRAAQEARGLKPTLRFAVPATASLNSSMWCTGRSASCRATSATSSSGARTAHRRSFFCNAVDDSAMGVTQVLRGDDHLTNTPRQLMVLDALGLRRPGYGHVGLLVGADGAPLSKRHGSTSVHEFRERGFLPGRHSQSPAAPWAHQRRGWLVERGGHARALPPRASGRAPARFDESQLVHWQKETLERMSAEQISTWLGSGDSPTSSSWCVTMWCCPPMPRHGVRWCAAICRPWAGRAGVIAAAGGEFFAAAADAFDQSSVDLKQLTKILKERTGRKGADLFMPLRAALTGQIHGPELAPLLKLMSPATARHRLKSHAQNS